MFFFAQDQITTFERIAERFGVPVAMLVFLAIAVGLSLRWIANNVAKPLVVSHTVLVETLKTTTVRNTESSERMAASNEDNARAMEAIAKRQEETGKLVVSAIADQTVKLDQVIKEQKPVSINLQPALNGDHKETPATVRVGG